MQFFETEKENLGDFIGIDFLSFKVFIFSYNFLDLHLQSWNLLC